MVFFLVIFSTQKSEKNLDGGVFLHVFIQQKLFEEKTLFRWEKWHEKRNHHRKNDIEKCDLSDGGESDIVPENWSVNLPPEN